MNKEDVKKAFGNNLKKYRTLAKKSQEDIALHENMSPTYISELERGEKCPSLDTIFKLGNALNVSPSMLVLFETESHVDSESFAIVKNALSNVPDEHKLKLAHVFEILAKVYNADFK
jgi:transcriptional regulator with XRE-family HTH domain